MLIAPIIVIAFYVGKRDTVSIKKFSPEVCVISFFFFSAQ